jgi:hypothetical protein
MHPYEPFTGVLLLPDRAPFGTTSGVTLADGRLLTAKGNWSARRFAVHDRDRVLVADLVNTSRVFSMRPDSLALELHVPVLSVVQAIGLAQCVRAAVEAQNAASAATS